MGANDVLQWVTAGGAALGAAAAWLQARGAKTSASESDTNAREANNLAAASNDIARKANLSVERIDARQTERNDVRWELDLRENDLLVVTNLGVDTAFEVLAYGEVNELAFRSESSDVVGGGELVTDLQGAITKGAAEHRRTIDAFNQTGGVVWLDTGHGVTAKVRILWRTPTDVWRHEDLKSSWNV